MYGLVLEGGGARGSYHIGAYKAIMEEGIEIGAIAGTSVGALNGAMIVQGDYEKALELWQDIKYSMVINANDEEIEKLKNKKLDKDDIHNLTGKIKSVITDRGLDITPLKELLSTYIDEEKIRNSPMDFGIVTINLTDFKPMEIFKEDIPQGAIKDYLLASSYLPIFKNEKLGGKRFLDGAFYDNLPFSLLQSRGYDKLIIVRTHAKGLTKRITPELEAIIISPSDYIGEFYEFEYEAARRNIELGYYDGLKALRGLRGIKYYIEPKGEQYYFNILLNLDEDKLSNIRECIRTPNIPDKRALFEHIIPKVASSMGLNKDFDYEDFVLALLERKASSLEISRFHIYSFDDLCKLVKNTPSKVIEKPTEHGPLSKIIEKVDLSTLFINDELILDIADIII